MFLSFRFSKAEEAEEAGGAEGAEGAGESGYAAATREESRLINFQAVCLVLHRLSNHCLCNFCFLLSTAIPLGGQGSR